MENNLIKTHKKTTKGKFNILRNYPMLSLLPYLLLLIITITPYLTCLDNKFVWDDKVNIYEASTLGQPDALKRIWFSFEMPSYLPLTDTLWYLESRIWGVQPQSARYFHAVSILLHAINVLLVCRVVRRLGFDLSAAWFVAALFAVHPWRVENVAWATEQKSLLSGIFVWIAWLGYLGATRNDKFRIRPYVISIIMFMMSLMAKPTAVALPLVLLLGEWFQGIRPDLKKYLKILPYLCLSIASGVITILKEFQVSSLLFQEFNISFIEQMLLVGRTAGYYVVHFLFPMRIKALYPNKWNISTALPLNWFCFIFMISLIILLMLLLLKGRLKFISLCSFGYLLLLAPVSGLIKMPYYGYSFVADRYMYLPLFFLLLCIVQMVRWIQIKLIKQRQGIASSIWNIVLVVFILLWSVQTAKTTNVWYDNITLWRHNIDTSHKNINSVAHINLGSALIDHGKLDEAIELYLEALRIRPDFAMAHYNLGIALTDQGKPNDAIVHYLEALRIKPDYEKAHNSLGIALSGQQKFKEAIRHFTKALRINPDYANPLNNIGIILSMQGKFKEAINHFSRALRIKPKFMEALHSLGSAQLSLGRNKKALDSFSQAYKLFFEKYGESHAFSRDSLRQIEYLKNTIDPAL